MCLTAPLKFANIQISRRDSDANSYATMFCNIYVITLNIIKNGVFSQAAGGASAPTPTSQRVHKICHGTPRKRGAELQGFGGSLVCQKTSHFSSAQQSEINRVMETSDAAGVSVSHGFRFCVVLCSVESKYHSGHCCAMRVVMLRFARLHEVLGVMLAARLREKLGSLGVQAVVCVVALLFYPTDRRGSVSQDLRFRVVVDGDMSGRFGSSGSVDDGDDNSGVSMEKLRGCVQAFKSCRPSLRSPLLPLSATSTACTTFF